MIAGVTFDDSTARTAAPGSDIWPITWGDDDQLYTAWGDGGGFGGTNSDGRVSFGVARIDGGKRDYRGLNLAGGKNAPRPSPFAGKSEGILALDRTLYLWRDGEGGSLGYFKGIALWRSDDRGATWRETGVRFSAADGDFASPAQGIFAPAFCQFGRAYAGARDHYVYLYAPEPWGPWTHVHTEFEPERWGAYTIIFTFVNKWLSADGLDFVLVHTKDDRWATIEGRFRLGNAKR